MSSDERSGSSAHALQYLTLSSAVNEIRLLQLSPKPHLVEQDYRIECSIHHFSLNSAPPFQALSYTWGKETPRRPFIVLEGSEFPIRSNLHSALHQILSNHTTPGFLWIDAICINQDDAAEKNAQVGLMKSIFERAERVIVWLGPTDSLSGDAFALLHLLAASQSSKEKVEEIIQDSQREGDWRALIDLFQRAYWRRAWVIQEVQVARRITVLCGGDKIEWVALLGVQRMLWDEHANSLIALAGSTGRLSNLHYWIRGRGARGLDHLPREPKGDLFRTLLFHRLKESTDPRDKIYSLLGLTSASGELEIDYKKDVRQVYIDATTYVIRTSRKLDVLWAIPPHRNRFNLPSWVSDWSIDEERQTELAWGLQEPKLEYIYHASGTRGAEAAVRPEEGVLVARGLIVTTIVQIGGAAEMTHSRDLRQAIIAIHAWRRLVEEYQGDDDTTVETFSRTLRCGRKRPDVSDDHGIFSRKLLHIMARVKMLTTEAQIKLLKESTEKDDVLAKAEIEGIAQQIFKRRFYLSSSGIMGLAPEDAKVADVVCVLLGCSVPVVLRAVGKHYIHVGDVYLDGYMSGRAIEESDSSDFEDFEIH